MALFDKLFSLKRRLDADNFDAKGRRSHQINPEQVRLLLFKECDWRGRRLLFDSSAIQKVPAGKHDKSSGGQVEPPCIVEVANGFSYMYKGPAEDTTVLGEMIFGAVAMNYKSVSLKIHIMDEPRRLMFTKVFCVPSRRISRTERRTSDRTDGSSFTNTSSMLRDESRPLNEPSFTEDGVALSFSMDRGDSGYCGERSPHSSVGSTYDYFTMFDAWDGGGGASQEDFYSFHSLPGRKLSTSSNGSWQRRTFQNIATRFELGTSSHRLDVPACDSQIYSNSSTSATSDSIASGSLLPPRKTKLGLAVLISVSDAAQLDLVRKCMEHSPQLQALVCRLRLATLAAGAGAAFVSTLHRASEDAARWLSDLIYGPRLQPMWLAMVTGEARTSNKLADTLLSDLCSVLAVGDTKTTNFFISTLLTHVLTYHLGWVTTVSPYESNDHRPSPTEPRRPYNALWAQLTDLCGSIGYPPRAARTIISGERNTQFINRLLSILTYFLRCGDIKRTEFRYKECAIKTISVKTISPNRMRETCDVAVSGDSQNNDSVSTLVASDVSLKKTATLADLRRQLSSSPECASSSAGLSQTSALKRNPTAMHSSLKASSDSSLNSTLSNDSVQEQKVVFVLGDDEKLVGLKNKSANGKSVKKSSKVQTEPTETQDAYEREGCEVRSTESPSKCCGQTLQHSKPIKHSGFKFEFDKYPQIVTNYMKSKNLEILDRHYIGKPGNLKLDNFQFDPMIVPPIQEEKCDACERCRLMESMLQTPTNASEMEYMNDLPRISEPQHAKETTVTDENRNHRELSPKTFVRKSKVNVVVVNSNSNASNLKVTCTSDDKTELNKTDRTLSDSTPTVSVLPQIPQISIEDVSMYAADSQSKIELRPLQRTKLKFTKSTNNLNSLLDELSIKNELKLECNNTSNVDSLNIDFATDNMPKSKSTSNISNVNETKSKGQLTSSNEDLMPLSLKVTEPHQLEVKKLSQEKEENLDVTLTEHCECKVRRSAVPDGCLLGDSSGHNVPDLITQGEVCERCQMDFEIQTQLHAKETITREENKDHSELSRELLIKRRKVNTMVANSNTNATNVKISSEDRTETPVANSTVAVLTPKISIQDVAVDSTNTQISLEPRPLQRSQLKFTKSTNNLSLLSQKLDTDVNELDAAGKLNDYSSSITSKVNLSKSKSEEIDLHKLVSKYTPEIATNNDAIDNLASKEIKLTIPPLKHKEQRKPELRRSRESETDRYIGVKSVTELSLPELCEFDSKKQSSGFDKTLLGGLSDRYVPDLILQGTIEKPSLWEGELRRDLDVTSYLNKQADAMPVQAVAIIGDTNTWEVRVVGRECGTGGMSSLVGAMLDAVPAMWRAKVPAHQCIWFLEHKLREFCVLSKTLADMLMSTDFCDMATLTKSLNIDVNDVPLLLAVATTHTPQVATRYGISYRRLNLHVFSGDGQVSIYLYKTLKNYIDMRHYKMLLIIT